jgi:site-specific recombinase XerD
MDSTEARATASKGLDRFHASYWTPRTRANYRFILTRWLDWCHTHGYDPVGSADAAALETFIAELKTAGCSSRSRVRCRLRRFRGCVLAGRLPCAS